MRIGIVGSHKEPTIGQREVLGHLLYLASELNHCDLVGADSYAHGIFLRLPKQGKKRIVHIYPSANPKHRAFLDGGFESYPEEDDEKRDSNLIHWSDILLCFPSGSLSRSKGRVGFCSREAKRQGKPCLVVLPNGVVKVQRMKTNG